MNYSPYNPRHLNPRRTRLPLVLLGLLVPTVAPATEPKVIHVGLSKSLFQDVPDPVVKALMISFGSLMHQQTGLNGQLATVPDAFELAHRLDSGKLNLGMVQGFEFAWVQSKYPNLKPLMLAVNKHSYTSVQLVTRSGSKIAGFDDLKGKKVSLPLLSGGHCHLFMERNCEKDGCSAGKFFSEIAKDANTEVALDRVINGAVDAAVVDSVLLECYTTIKPGCASLLKTVAKSEPFPPAVIVYRDGSLSKQTLETFRNGMLTANKNPKSRGLMTLFNLTAFEPLPAGFQQAVANIRDAYPAPEAQESKTIQTTKAAGN